MNTHLYTSGKVDSFLRSYQIFVDDLTETALEWDTLDAEQQSDYRADLIQIWSSRKLLGVIFKAGQLTPLQENQLATLDRQLLEHSGFMQHCFGFDLSHLLAIFRWGTPLTQSVQPLQIAIEPIWLDRMATAFVLSPTT